MRAFFLTYRRFSLPLELMRDFLARYKEIELYVASKDDKHRALVR